MNRPTLILLSFSLLLWFSGCNENGRDETGVILHSGEVHEGWYFAAGDKVIIDGTVNGDVYAAAAVITVGGTINGDLIAAGGNLTIDGMVSDDIRACGGNITIGGEVGKDITICGGNVSVGSSSIVSGNLLTLGGNAEIAGSVAKQVKAAVGNMTLTGSVGEDLDFAGGELDLSYGASVGGDVNAVVQESDHVRIADGTVMGDVNITTKPEDEEADHGIIGFHPVHFWFKFIWIAALLLTGLVLVFIFPKQVNGIGSAITDRLGEVTLFGLAGFLAFPVVISVLFMTVIGVPLALLLLASFLWLLYLSQLSLGILVGQRLFRSKEKTGWALLGALTVGILIVQGLTFIPVVRFLVIAAGILFGLGALLLVLKTEFEQRRSL